MIRSFMFAIALWWGIEDTESLAAKPKSPLMRPPPPTGAYLFIYFMEKDPAFLFYTQDWIVGTQTLTMAERGQYITLLANMHQMGRLDEETICLLVGSCSVKLLSKFERDRDGYFYSKKLEKVIEKRQKYTDSRRKNGLKGGRPKSSENNHMVNGSFPYAKAYDNHTENENENENISLKSNKITINSNEIDSKQGGAPKPKFTPPLIGDVEQYFFENATGWSPDKCRDQARRFHSHYESNGWHVGKNKMQKWRSSAAGWVLRQNDYEKNGNQTKNGSGDAARERVGRMAKGDLDNFIRGSIPDVKI